ncbi:MAG TPA: hypothetical protein VE444_08555 [Gaiellaceae bacterium]|nr:hypothetical protein [Gaiellaceae bacterium]
MRRALWVLAAVAALSGCAGDEELRELQPGSVATIGVVAAPGPREAFVPRGVQVAAAAINAAGGIGGAARVELVVGPANRLRGRGIRLLVLPCDPAAARAGAAAAPDAVAIAPCDDGAPLGSGVFTTGLSPARQAELLSEHVDGRAVLAEPRSARGRRVRSALDAVLEGSGNARVSPEAPEGVLPPPDPEGTIYATYGFPEPGSELDEFYERFKAVFDGRPASIVAALASDAMSALAVAIELAGTTEPSEVRRILVEEGFRTSAVLGDIEFRPGDPKAEVGGVVLRAEDGRFRILARG